MSFGTLTTAMQAKIREHVQGREVWDLGAGDLVYARRLIQLGARKVIAIEKEWGLARAASSSPQIECRRSYFAEVELPEGGIEVAWVSWPLTDRMAVRGLVPLVKAAPLVIYLGCNTGGSACGPSDLWRHLVRREVLAYEPMQRNTLIVYGQPCGDRVLRGEEMAALSPKVVHLDEVEKWSRRLSALMHEGEEPGKESHQTG